MLLFHSTSYQFQKLAPTVQWASVMIRATQGANYQFLNCKGPEPTSYPEYILAIILPLMIANTWLPVYHTQGFHYRFMGRMGERDGGEGVVTITTTYIIKINVAVFLLQSIIL